MKSSFSEITENRKTPKMKNFKCPHLFSPGPSPAEEHPKKHGGPPMPSRGRAEAAPAQPSPRDPATARGAAGSRLVGGDSAPLPNINLIPGTHSPPWNGFSERGGPREVGPAQRDKAPAEGERGKPLGTPPGAAHAQPRPSRGNPCPADPQGSGDAPRSRRN